ncbi:MAG TPA: ATPase [Algoriphagus sp.]|jgi:predicted AAA+ superfamily ATPase|uniref:ATP-binding protein n=4 Tax=Algoriphagus TaxID=246875 RepID=UPI000C6C059F|nr:MULTISPECIES: ATP-binding protein [unclassified Algoriphagus]MAL13624.1 ATPase [Algoriphagus sp.]QYH39954.1 ATP-binding protein [Algoriphagus sp. NBT04N3]HAD50879.1 ATPase [Algoriphagus sp.]HAH37469.1 ATPase [Algoriphagus sp.]HCB46334.1 ATPase [Algoriphagus sp.]
MIKRFLSQKLEELLPDFPAIAILGARQVGKTTLAQALAENFDQESIYLDLESPSDQAKLAEAEQYFNLNESKLIILDEIQRMPDLFQVLRGVIDRKRKKGFRSCQFLILGSASLELIRQSSESLAGRIAYEELGGFTILEVENNLEKLWLRGGFPDSFLASSDESSMTWRQNFITTYLERDIPQIAQFVPTNRLRRLWTMLAHEQGQLINFSKFGASLDLSSPTVKSYVELLEDLLLVRSLQPWTVNVRKRLVKTPKVYIRDSGITHALLQVDTFDSLLGHPILGFSWEGFVIENILSVLPKNADYGFYRTSAGAELDLVIQLGSERWAIEIKRTLSPKLSKGFSIAAEDVKATHRFFVYAGKEEFPLSENTNAIGLAGLLEKIN